MADIYGSHFEFGGITSRQYGLVIANLNTSRWTQLSGSSHGITIYNRNANRKYLIDDDYSDSPITFDIDIVTEGGRTLEVAEKRQIEKWLFNCRNYRRLYFDSADDLTGETYEFVNGIVVRNYLNCRFINPERIEGNGGTVGYKVSLEADSNMFWQDEVVKEFSVNNGASDISTTVVVDVDTDFYDYIYPKVTITVGSVGGNITVVNNSDDSSRQTTFVGMSPYSSVVMKGELNYVSGDYYSKFSGRNFIRLLDGENKFMVLGDIDKIKFEYAARRMM